MQDCVVLFVSDLSSSKDRHPAHSTQGDSITSRQDVPQSLQALMGGERGFLRVSHPPAGR